MGEREIARTAWARRLLIFLGALFAFTCGFNYAWNHWYVHGPLLLDAGWHSGVIFHRGWNPQSLLIEYPVPRAFFSFHLSPFMSFFGVLSTWFPGDRALYYCIVHGLVYAPFGAVAATMLPERMRASEAALAMLSSVCLMFSGQMLACIGYPHLEAFVPAAIAMMLAAILRGRPRAAVVWLLLCTTLREDAGFHAASFAFAALACNLTKRPLPLATKTLVKLTALAFLVSVLIFVLQKKLWPGPGLFREEYLGEPTFAHVTLAEMSRRMGEFGERCGFIYVPLLATVLIAVIRRDPRYLLGWVVELPWLLINLLAKQPSKARFELYTGFPFIASAFWVLVYAHVDVLHRKPRRLVLLRTWLPFVLVSVASTFVTWRQSGWLGGVMENTLWRGSTDRRAIEALAGSLRANPNPTARTRVDLAMAAWTSESMAPTQVIEGEPPRGLEGATEFYFFRNGFDAGRYPVWLAHEPALDHCGRLRGTQVRWCGRGALPSGFDPMSPLLERVGTWPSVVRTASGSLVLPKAEADDVVALLPLFGITPGDYRATWSYDASGCAESAGGIFDVSHSGTTIAQARAAARGSAVTLTFRIDPARKPSDLEGWELRASQWRCAVTITELRFVVESASDVARIADASARSSARHDALAPLGPRLVEIARSGPPTRIDPALATWAHAAVAPGQELDVAHGLAGASGVYFFREGAEAQRMLGWLAHEPGLARCGALPGTEVRYCGAGPLPEGFVQSSPLLDRAIMGAARRTAARTIDIPGMAAPASPQLVVWGPFASLLPGDYAATWTYHASGCATDATGTFDVARDSGRVAEGRALASEHQVMVPFQVDAATTGPWEFRAYGWACDVTLDDLSVGPAVGGQFAPVHPL